MKKYYNIYTGETMTELEIKEFFDAEECLIEAYGNHETYIKVLLSINRIMEVRTPTKHTPHFTEYQRKRIVKELRRKINWAGYTSGGARLFYMPDGVLANY